MNVSFGTREYCRNYTTQAGIVETYKRKETGRLKWLHVCLYKEQLKWKGSDGQYFPLDAVMLDSRPMTGQVFSPLILMLVVGKRVLVCWPNWYIVFCIIHAAVFCTWSYMTQNFCFLVRLRKLYGPVARGNSIRNHSLAAVHGRPSVFWQHGRKNS